MSRTLVPTPEEFRVFCEFGFSQKDENIRIFYACCTQCGLESVRDDLKDPAMFMFATVEDLEVAGKDGELMFHHGVRAEDGEIYSTEKSARIMVNVMRDQGMEVRWSGEAEQRFRVVVDRWSYAQLAEILNKRIQENDKIPTTALELESDYPNYKIMLWEDHDGWRYDVSDRNDPSTSYERSTESTREEAIQAALSAVEQVHLDVN
jgi:hypothetical protein